MSLLCLVWHKTLKHIIYYITKQAQVDKAFIKFDQICRFSSSRHPIPTHCSVMSNLSSTVNLINSLPWKIPRPSPPDSAVAGSSVLNVSCWSQWLHWCQAARSPSHTQSFKWKMDLSCWCSSFNFIYVHHIHKFCFLNHFHWLWEYFTFFILSSSYSSRTSLFFKGIKKHINAYSTVACMLILW